MMNRFAFRPASRRMVSAALLGVVFLLPQPLRADDTRASPPPAHTSLIEQLFFDRPLRQIKPTVQAPDFWTPRESEALPPIGGIHKPLTVSFIKRYSTGGNKLWLKDAFKRGGPYLAFIQRRLREAEMPEMFLYLPVIESAYNQTAVSSSGASGLWQFMQNSIAPWLKITAFVDERFDFWASTDAALAKLKSNYLETHDWPLALAAYNSGLGAIRRVIAQHPGKTYWELADMKALKSETLSYVPKLLAVYYIASNPRRMGFEDFWPEEVEWAEIPVPKQVDVRQLARIAAVDAAELKKMNAELRYDVTPPGAGYRLKVYAKDKERVIAALSQTDAPQVFKAAHIIVRGDTIYALARHYGVTVARLLEANPGINVNTLKIGQQIIIPPPPSGG